MWILIIILLNTVPGISTVTVLQTYPTSQECHSEREESANNGLSRMALYECGKSR